LVARFWNLGRAAQEYSVTLASGISAAARATHIETDLEPLPLRAGKVNTRIAASQIQTLRIVPAGNAMR
jgi:hypothetical protein